MSGSSRGCVVRYSAETGDMGGLGLDGQTAVATPGGVSHQYKR